MYIYSQEFLKIRCFIELVKHMIRKLPQFCSHKPWQVHVKAVFRNSEDSSSSWHIYEWMWPVQHSQTQASGLESGFIKLSSLTEFATHMNATCAAPTNPGEWPCEHQKRVRENLDRSLSWWHTYEWNLRSAHEPRQVALSSRKINDRS